MGNTNKLTLPPTATYEQMYELMSVAADCIKASNQRIAALETENKALSERIRKLEVMGFALNGGKVTQTYKVS